MSKIEEIISAGIELGEQIAGNVSNWRAQEQALREMIAAALADARREGVDAMREAAGDAAQRAAGRGLSAPAVHLCIRALPLPTGGRQAVLLADHMTDAHADAVLRAAGSALQNYTMQSTRDGLRQAVRAIEAAVLAANGLEVRRAV